MAGPTIPTGFEAQQARIALREKLAEALMQNGMMPQQGMRSPFQALGALAQAFSGAHAENQAVNESADLNKQILQSYQGARQQFYADKAAGMSNIALASKYGGNPYIQEDPGFKAVMEGLTEGEKSANTITKVGDTMGRQGDYLGKTLPSSANDAVIRITDPKTGQRYWEVNPLKALASMAGNPNLVANISSLPTTLPDPYAPNVVGTPPSAPTAPTGAPTSQGLSAQMRAALHQAVGQVESGNHDYNPDGSPMRSSAGAKYQMGVLPSTAGQPGYGVQPAASDTASEYDRVGNQYLDAMLKQYPSISNALAAYNQGPGNVNHALSSGSPVPGQGYVSKVMNAMQGASAPGSLGTGTSRPPDGLDSQTQRPIWNVNGNWYFNPEGTEE